jgi:hypothetical protein
MSIVIHVSSICYTFAVFSRDNHLLSISDLFWWRESSFVSSLKEGSNMIEVIFPRLDVNLYEFVVMLNILVSWIFLLERMVNFSWVLCPDLLLIIYRGVINSLSLIFLLSRLFRRFIHLNDLVIERGWISLTFWLDLNLIDFIDILLAILFLKSNRFIHSNFWPTFIEFPCCLLDQILFFFKSLNFFILICNCGFWSCLIFLRGVF